MTNQPQFIDTNIFLKFLTKDDPSKAARCYALFQKARKGEVSLLTSESVLAEVVFILSSPKLYQLKPAEVRDLLLPLVNLAKLKCPAKKTFRTALEIYAANKLDFADALTIAHLREKKLKQIYSYDRDFDRFADLQRLEP